MLDKSQEEQAFSPFNCLVKSILLLIVFSVSISHAAIFQCKDPATGKVTFTDKACSTSQTSSTVKGKGEEKEDRIYSSYKIDELEALLVKKERELIDAYRYLSVTSDNRDNGKFKKNSDSEKLAWTQYRNSVCNKKYFEKNRNSNEDISRNREILTCKLRLTEEKIATFTSKTATGKAEEIVQSDVRVTIPPGKEGLAEALRQGLIEPASSGDLQEWLSRAGATNKRSELFSHTDKYVIRQRIRFSGGLHGAHSCIFLVPDSTLAPSGDYGHSALLYMDSGSCIGAICNAMSR